MNRRLPTKTELRGYWLVNGIIYVGTILFFLFLICAAVVTAGFLGGHLINFIISLF